MQWPRGSIGVKRVVDRKDRDVALLCECAVLLKRASVLAVAVHRYAKPDPIRCKSCQTSQYIVQPTRRWLHQTQFLAAIGMTIFHGLFVRVGLFGSRMRQYDQQQIFQIRRQIIKAQDAATLGRAHISDSQ